MFLKIFRNILCPGHKICVGHKCCARGKTSQHLGNMIASAMLPPQCVLVLPGPYWVASHYGERLALATVVTFCYFGSVVSSGHSSTFTFTFCWFRTVIDDVETAVLPECVIHRYGNHGEHLARQVNHVPLRRQRSEKLVRCSMVARRTCSVVGEYHLCVLHQVHNTSYQRTTDNPKINPFTSKVNKYILPTF